MGRLEFMMPKEPSGRIDAGAELGAKRKSSWKRALILAAFIAALIGLWASGVTRYLSYESLREHREDLTDFVASHRALAIASFAGIYAVATMTALPGALWLTIAGGFLFGLFGGAAIVVVAATFGASLLFLLARGALASFLADRAGPFLKKIEGGFQEEQAFYLLAMRLVPAMPFFIANILPGLIGARFSTFVWTTFIGIMPGVLAYAWIGAGLGALMDQNITPDISSVVRQIAPPLAAIGALPLIAIAVKKLRGRSIPASAEDQ